MIYVYGASDDLIEIQGDITEEFSVGYEYQPYLGFSNGFLARVVYSNEGDWHFTVNGDPAFRYQIHNVGSDKAVAITGSDYSQVLELADDIKWVVLGEKR